MTKKISLLITTKNRLTDLQVTLANLSSLLNSEEVECLLYDDGSTDGTSQFVQANYPNIKLYRNEVSKGYMFNRNFLLNNCIGDYAISLDDDAHFLSKKVATTITEHFEAHPKCGVIAFRIFWGKAIPVTTSTSELPTRVKGFVGCGHIWNMKAWRDIPNYPEWFVFYGEEDFAAYQLFKKNWEIHYLPEVLVNHRVDIKSRKKQDDYQMRLRRSLRSGWYLYFMFYPLSLIPKRIGYTLWRQIQLKVLKGDWKASLGILQAVGDVVIHIPRLLKQSNRLTLQEFQVFSKLADVKVYWKPEKK